MNYKTTIALIVLLAVVGAYFYFIERHNPAASRERDRAPITIDTGRPLFSADDLSTESIDRVTIERGNEFFVFEKDDADWFQVEPVRFKLSPWASSSLIDSAASLTLYEALEGQTLDDPLATVTLHDTEADRTFVLHLGQTTIGGRARLRLEADHAAAGNVLLVSNRLHDQVRDLKVNDLRHKVLDAPGADRAQSLIVEREGDNLALYKAPPPGAGWFLDAARTQRAAAAEVTRLFNSFSRLGIDRFVEDAPPSLSAYGLDRPRMTITLTTPDVTQPDDTTRPGQTIRLMVGRPADLDGNSFFAVRTRGETGGEQRGDDVVFTVTRSALEPFERPLDELREMRLFTEKTADVRRLRIERDGQALALERTDAGAFAFAAPDPGFAADYNEATELIERVLALEATGYIAAHEPDGEPAVRLRVNDIETAFYREAEAYRVTRTGEAGAYVLDAETIAPLLAADALSLRNRTVLDLPRDRVQAVALVPADGPRLRFVRDEAGEWSLEGHDDFERDDFSQLLTLLAPLRAESWPAGDAALERVIAEVVMETADGASHTLTVGPTHARLGDADELFVASDALRRRLAAEYRPRTVIDLGPDDIASITRTTSDGSRTVRREDYVYEWDADEPLDSAAAASLFDTLAGLRVQRFVAGSPGQDAPPIATLTVQPRSGAAITLKLMPDGRTATREPGDGGYRDRFTLDQGAWRALTAPLAQGETADAEATIDATK